MYIVSCNAIFLKNIIICNLTHVAKATKEAMSTNAVAHDGKSKFFILFHSHLLDMGLLIAIYIISYPTRAHGIIVDYYSFKIFSRF